MELREKRNRLAKISQVPCWCISDAVTLNQAVVSCDEESYVLGWALRVTNTVGGQVAIFDKSG